MPAIAQSLGNMLTGRKPGIVLISLTTGSPSAGSRKSTRAKPAQSSARNARTAQSCTALAAAHGLFDEHLAVHLERRPHSFPEVLTGAHLADAEAAAAVRRLDERR